VDRIELMKALIKKGTRLCLKTKSGHSLIHLSLENKSSLYSIAFLLDIKLRPTLEDLKCAAVVGSLRALHLLLDHSFHLNLKEDFPDILYLILVKFRGPLEERVMMLRVVQKLVETFGVNPLDETRCPLNFVRLLLLRNSFAYEFEDIVDYCMARGLLDDGHEDGHHPLGSNQGEDTFLEFALKVGDYSSAKKLIHNFSDITICSLNSFIAKTGYSFILMLCFYAGFKFPFDLTISGKIHPESDLNPNQIMFWIESKKRSVLPLNRMASIRVRKVYGKKCVDIIEENKESNPWLKSELMLQSVCDEFEIQKIRKSSILV
jgi:hypothetical protein